MAITDNEIKFSFLREYHLIMKDFDKLLAYIDPSEENLGTFSHRTFELLLRSCTAIEAIFKVLSRDLGYPSENLDMRDYFRINNDSNLELSDYIVKLSSWRSGKKIVVPYEGWHDGQNYKKLPWYKAYNNVKHDRDQNFKEANFENVINATAGLFTLLYS
ncbi:hypothetical protein GF389_03110, partial [Candidatus Dojkabacteria bacterium]|nr:hypothetical protein [Candidatus Dojkabacteria bacterium]